MNTRATTSFQQQAEKYQSDIQATKKQVLGDKAWLIVVAVAVLLLATGLAVWSWFIDPYEGTCAAGICVRSGGAGSLSTVVPGVGLLLALGFLMSGAIAFFKTLSLPSGVVVCPECGTEHRLVKEVRNFRCPKCGTLLLVGKLEERATPQFSQCGYCGLKTATTPHHCDFACLNHGVHLSPGHVHQMAKGGWLFYGDGRHRRVYGQAVHPIYPREAGD